MPLLQVEDSTVQSLTPHSDPQQQDAASVPERPRLQELKARLHSLNHTFAEIKTLASLSFYDHAIAKKYDALAKEVSALAADMNRPRPPGRFGT
jgi:hypothetical protein